MTYVLFFIGILGTLASMALLGQSRPLRGGVITAGTVVDTQQETSTIRDSGPRRRMTTYAPVIEFTDAMLSWPPGPRDTDGVWAKHWYAAVLKTTTFQPYRPKDEPVGKFR